MAEEDMIKIIRPELVAEYNSTLQACDDILAICSDCLALTKDKVRRGAKYGIGYLYDSEGTIGLDVCLYIMYGMHQSSDKEVSLLPKTFP
jgi:hypothetical protein